MPRDQTQFVMGRRFAGASTVGRYWQARCGGFEVRSTRGRRLGTVDGFEFDRGREVSALVIRRRARRPLRVPPECVGSVDPWQETVFVTTRRDRHARRWAATAAHGTAHAARSAGAGAVAGAVTVGRASPRHARSAWLAATAAAVRVWGLRRLVAPTRRLLGRWGRRAALAAAFVGWLYAVAVFTAVRLVLLLLLAVTRATRGVAATFAHPSGAAPVVDSGEAASEGEERAPSPGVSTAPPARARTEDEAPLPFPLVQFRNGRKAARLRR
jgi:hypothetical protein